MCGTHDNRSRWHQAWCTERDGYLRVFELPSLYYTGHIDWILLRWWPTEAILIRSSGLLWWHPQLPDPRWEDLDQLLGPAQWLSHSRLKMHWPCWDHMIPPTYIKYLVIEISCVILVVTSWLLFEFSGFDYILNFLFVFVTALLIFWRTKLDGQPSHVLWIGYPPSVRIGEQMLHNGMIIFGEVETIRSFPSQEYSCVEFRSVDDARRAKEGLQSYLFDDPRISIMYSSSDVGPTKDYTGFHPSTQHQRLYWISIMSQSGDTLTLERIATLSSLLLSNGPGTTFYLTLLQTYRTWQWHFPTNLTHNFPYHQKVTCFQKVVQGSI